MPSSRASDSTAMLGFPPPTAVDWPSRYEESLTLYEETDGAWNLLELVTFPELMFSLWRPASIEDSSVSPSPAPSTLADLFFMAKLLWVSVFLAFGENFIFV